MFEFLSSRKTEPIQEPKNSVEKGESKKSESRLLKFLPNKVKNLILAGVLLISPIASTSTPDAEQKFSMKGDGEKELLKPTQENTEESSHFEDIDVEHTFTKINEQGELVFNGYSLIAPIDINLEIEKTQTETVKFDVPYQYARYFEKDKKAKDPIDEKDHERLANYIDKELKTELANIFWGFDVNKEVYERDHPQELDPSSLTVTEIQVIGTASPEGPRQKGKETLRPGNVDEENIRLAEVRAGTGLDLTVQELQKMGINTEFITENLKSITAKEIQFSELEMSVLTELSSSYGNPDALQNIFELTKDYNDGKITDTKIKNELDSIIGSKRTVQIEITFEGKTKKVISIPIPWLVLLPLLWALRKRKDQEDKSEDDGKPKQKKDEQNNEKEKIYDPIIVAPIPTDSTKIQEQDPEKRESSLIITDLSKEKRNLTKEEIEQGWARKHYLVDYLEHERSERRFAQEKYILQIEKEKNKIFVPELVVKTELPEKETFEYQDMEETTLIDDIGRYFDDKKIIRKGLDYRALCDVTNIEYEKYQNEKDRENVLTLRILGAWKMHDIECCVEAGAERVISESRLNYEEQPQQIKWARMHAKKLLLLVEKKRIEQKDYIKTIAEETQNLLVRRLERRSK